MKSVILSLHEKLINQTVTAEALASGLFAKMKQDQNPIFITKTEDAALSVARKVDKKIQNGEPIGLLEGIPMSLKDNLSTDGIRTTCGSKMLADYLPIYDAHAWELLKKEGAVLLGKTNLDEFGMGSSGETSYFGTVFHPMDANKVAGGSSSGAAAAVLSGYGAYALGTDTGGSVRQPAAFCGLVGLKPTYGAVSRRGLIAYASSLDQIGILAQTVTDAALVFDAIAKKDEKDDTSVGRTKKTMDARTFGLHGKVIGIPEETRQGLPEETAKALDAAVDRYRALGAEIRILSMPELSLALPVYYILASAEAASNLGRYDGIRFGHRADCSGTLTEQIIKNRSEGFGAEVKRRILLGNFVLSKGYYDDYYRKAQLLRRSIRKAFADLFGKVDLLLTPVTDTAAFARGFALENAVDTYRTDRYNIAVNLAGLPAVTVPCGYQKDGLPFAHQLIAPAFAEEVLLSAAYAFEEAANGVYQTHLREVTT